MSEKLQTTSVPPSVAKATLQPQDIASEARWESSICETSPSTFSSAARAGQTQSCDLLGGCKARNGSRLPASETHVEMDMAGNQPIVDRECYDSMQKSLESSSMMLMDILSEIREVQLRLTALEQALSNLWYPQQPPYWEYTPHYTEFFAPNFIDMQAENYDYLAYSSQPDVYFGNDAGRQS